MPREGRPEADQDVGAVRFEQPRRGADPPERVREADAHPVPGASGDHVRARLHRRRQDGVGEDAVVRVTHAEARQGPATDRERRRADRHDHGTDAGARDADWQGLQKVWKSRGARRGFRVRRQRGRRANRGAQAGVRDRRVHPRAHDRRAHHGRRSHHQLEAGHVHGPRRGGSGCSTWGSSRRSRGS